MDYSFLSLLFEYLSDKKSSLWKNWNLLWQSFTAVYEADCLEEEPAYQYVPDTDTPHHHGTDALAQSMLLLADGLASGLLLAQFDKLYRKKPGLSTADAKRPDNQLKNRYRDISPCESCLLPYYCNMYDHVSSIFSTFNLI